MQRKGQKEKEKVLYEQLIKDPNHPNSISEMMGTSFHPPLGELKMCLDLVEVAGIDISHVH